MHEHNASFGLPWWLSGRESACDARDPGLIPGLERKEKEMATHSSILAWNSLWTEEPGGLQSMGSQRVGHVWATKHSTSRWKRKVAKKRSPEPSTHNTILCIVEIHTHLQAFWKNPRNVNEDSKHTGMLSWKKNKGQTTEIGEKTFALLHSSPPFSPQSKRKQERKEERMRESER